MRIHTKNTVKVLLGLAIGLFFLYLFFKKANFSEIIHRLGETRAEFVLLSALSTLIGFYYRALRWKYLLMPVKKIGITRLFSTMSIGYMVSTYTPRLGELVRPYVLGDKERISKSAAFATVVVERVLDLLSVLFLFSIYLLFYAGSVSESSFRVGGFEITMADVRKSGVLVATITLSLTLFLLGLRFKKLMVLKLTGELIRILPEMLASRIKGFVSSFADGLALFQTPRNIFLAVFYSAVTWFFILMAVWVMPLAYDLNPLPFSSMFFLIFMIAIGVSVPTPGAIGSFHLMCGAGFGLLGVKDINTVTSMVLLLHAASVIPINVIGLVSLWKEGISLYALGGARV